MTLVRLIFALACLPLAGCVAALPETIYMGASLNEDGRGRTYNVGGTWRIKPAPVAKVADVTPANER